MLNRIRQMAAAYFGRQMELRVRLFHILALTGISLSLWSSFTAALVYKRPVNFFIYTFYLLLSTWLLWYSSKTGNYQFCSLVTVVAVFLVGFPLFFFNNGTYTGSIPFYFIFAVVFTAFMLEGKMAFVFGLVELAVYIGVCLFAYRYMPLPAHSISISSVISGFTVVSASLGITMFLQFRLYGRQNKELEAARKKLAEDNAALEKINQLKAEFLANVSHELKTPLTVVSGYAQTAANQLKSSGSTEALVADKMVLISAEAERMALMVSQILDVTRIEENRMTVDIRPCNLDEVIYTAVQTHYPILNKNENLLDIKIEEALSPVLADAARISQVLVNLISNAIRYTSRGVITLTAKKLDDAFVSVSVSDTGCGIRPEMREHLFERYASSSGKGSGTGTGLGLFICKHIVQEHGGSIFVDSEPLKGTRVTFTLPTAPNCLAP